MAKFGNVYENPVTCERAVVRVDPADTGGSLMIADLYLRPKGAIVGEHVHPSIEERFTVIRGKVGFRLGGRASEAAQGQSLVVPPGTPHDFWNAGDGEALVRVEIRPGDRFQQMILNLFGLAQDGKTNRKGMPNLLQVALISREFSDVVYFTKPPKAVQSALFGILAPIARVAGYRGSYPEYLSRPPSGRAELED